VNRLAAICEAIHRPVQALYLMTAPVESSISHHVAEFAWRVKNWVRPLGLAALRLPCQLVGTGMAFPWEVIRRADLAQGWIVEDLKLGLDLAEAGYPPLFCPTICVTSQFASSIKGSVTQRQRWEHGHIKTILTFVPRLLWRSIMHGNWQLLALTLDLAVPPLSLLGVLLAAMFMITGLAAFFGLSSVSLAISVVNLLAFLFATFLAWLKYGRQVLPPIALLSVTPYAFGKISFYLRVLFNKMDARWIRTDRTKP
jgi:cellulose synthase/poly-beta-1,6-N-acetylglucosamine synthase-like glycosyltransferase